MNKVEETHVSLSIIGLKQPILYIVISGDVERKKEYLIEVHKQSAPDHADW